MKTTLFVLLILSTAVAFGQAGALSSQVQVLQLPEHPQHAETRPMAHEQYIVAGGADNYHVEHGERPLSDFGMMSVDPSPLGDVARAYRKEKMTGKKAEIILEKQGS